ncbi:unnamed protein product, partial [Prorocentrum cordatum]
DMGNSRRPRLQRTAIDHLTRTADEPRQEVVSDARITAIREETPTVREISLEVSNPAFTFRPGNWVDFFIDGCPKVGGYSMCSVPAELPVLRLAVKRSQHPPAAWCHSEAAQPGADVQIKAGGKFDWEVCRVGSVEPGLAHRIRDSAGVGHLLLVAGGIGINPLYSILQAATTTPRESAPELQRITLLYSASRPSELAFRGHLERLASKDDRIRLALHATRSEEEPWSGPSGRIGDAQLDAALADAAVPPEEVLSYVCGPPKMTDELVALLRARVPRARVRFEKWW